MEKSLKILEDIISGDLDMNVDKEDEPAKDISPKIKESKLYHAFSKVSWYFPFME